jgi:hypothetical protein
MVVDLCGWEGASLSDSNRTGTKGIVNSTQSGPLVVERVLAPNGLSHVREHVDFCHTLNAYSHAFTSGR